MKSTNANTTLLAAAAIAGILIGSAGATAKAATTSRSTCRLLSSPGVLDNDKKGETHECAGKNSCKGKGGCKSGDHGCAGKNSCKGKGGCETHDGKPVKK